VRCHCFAALQCNEVRLNFTPKSRGGFCMQWQ